MTIWQWAVAGLVADYLIFRIQRILPNYEPMADGWLVNLVGCVCMSLVSAGAGALYGYLWNL